MDIDTNTTTWVTMAAAKRRTGMHNYSILKAAAVGAVRVRALPGSTPRYALDDLDRLKSEREAARA